MNTEKPILEIEPLTEVFYPTDELKDLKRCVSLQGFVSQAVKSTGISKDTIKKYVREGKGQFSKVNALREFVKSFNQAAA